MPLKKGKGHIQQNIKELMDEYKHGDGKIGNVKPKNARHAAKIAAAIAYGIERKARAKRKRA